jgi:hypothetical protein
LEDQQWKKNARALKYFNKYEGGLNTSFIWDFDSNPIPGFNNTIPNSMSDPGNQEALRRSIRKPRLIDYAVAAASYFDWIGWLLF